MDAWRRRSDELDRLIARVKRLREAGKQPGEEIHVISWTVSSVDVKRLEDKGVTDVHRRCTVARTPWAPDTEPLQTDPQSGDVRRVIADLSIWRIDPRSAS